VRFPFLDWKPDLEDESNQGLTVADNVIHEPEGYKAAHLLSAGSFATTGGLAASGGTILSVVSKKVGPNNDQFAAWITSGTTPALNVGINGVTATSDTTGYPLSFATLGSSQEVVAFDVTEYAGKIFFVVTAIQNEVSPSTTSTLTHAGYMDY